MTDDEVLPWEDSPWEELPVTNPIPEGCTCDYEWERTLADASYTTLLTRKDPECPLHRVS